MSKNEEEDDDDDDEAVGDAKKVAHLSTLYFEHT
jgi:hypothetical protein